MERSSNLQEEAITEYGYGSHASMRHDQVTAHAVQIGIRLQPILGTGDAALFLKNNVVAIEVALRVLLHPRQRRQR